MTFLLVPNEARADRAEVWVGAINETFDEQDALVEYDGGAVPVPGWKHWATESRSHRIAYQRVIVPNLAPRRTYSLRLRVGGAVVSDGSVTTLPDRLPVPGETPFTVLLGSCFFHPEDRKGDVGRNYRLLPRRPDIKILSGDQVYLDNPPGPFYLPRLHPSQWLEDNSFKSYFDAWAHAPAMGGFRELLKHGANFFSSDDHEFWNNAPDRGLNVLTYTTTRGQRETWHRIGRDLYRIFQTERSLTGFRVGPLSFCFLDTRINRRPDRAALVSGADLDGLRAWSRELREGGGLGVLVIGQPLLAEEGSAVDYGLRDYPEFREIVNLLKSSERSVILLTGDVHFGRMASAPLLLDRGTRLLEIISSPMQLVPKAAGNYKDAPFVFAPATTERRFWADKQDHFLTLEFLAASSSRVQLKVIYWPIDKAGGMPRGVPAHTHPIELPS